ncbi:MAG: DUF2798 domain-containing protein [Lachnospiraceae bacterium]|nr:DUF2798 domain-containing protein [Lachnospiraceae bacterium]
MPRNTFQRVIFTCLGVLFMAYTMSLYNKVLASGVFVPDTFRQAGVAWFQRAPLAFVMQFFIVQKFATKMCARYPTDNKMLYYAIRTGFSVLLMCPVMSLYSNIIYVGLSKDLIFNWLPKMVLNWPFAFMVQIFLLGPWNRLLFNLIFGKANRAG